MGCSAAKNLTVEHLDGSRVTELAPVDPHNSESRKVSIPRTPSDVPALESVEPTTEVLENDSLNHVQKTGKSKLSKAICSI